jgi:hypothetical protein
VHQGWDTRWRKCIFAILAENGDFWLPQPIRQMVNGGEFYLVLILEWPLNARNSLLTPNIGGEALKCTLLHAAGQTEASSPLSKPGSKSRRSRRPH